MCGGFFIVALRLPFSKLIVLKEMHLACEIGTTHKKDLMTG
jgi:hypothetical protein